MKTNLHTDREAGLALQAAVLAGKAIMEVFGGVPGTTYKEDQSPVTLADKNAHTVIIDTLEPAGIPVISEEMALPEHRERKTWERYWLVDPLDGTKEFLRGGSDFCVNIALMEYDQPVMGLLLLPVSKRLYLGDKRTGRVSRAQLDQLTIAALEGASWQVLPPLETPHQIKVVASYSHLSPDTSRFIEQLKARFGSKRIELVRKGSAIKFALLAEGEAQVYPRFSPCMEWDTAAGQAICEAMGITMVRIEDRAPFEYNKEELVNPGFLLTAPGIEL